MKKKKKKSENELQHKHEHLHQHRHENERKHEQNIRKYDEVKKRFIAGALYDNFMCKHKRVQQKTFVHCHHVHTGACTCVHVHNRTLVSQSVRMHMSAEIYVDPLIFRSYPTLNLLSTQCLALYRYFTWVTDCCIGSHSG